MYGGTVAVVAAGVGFSGTLIGGEDLGRTDAALS